MPDQIFDRTKGVRPWTFFEGGVVGHGKSAPMNRCRGVRILISSTVMFADPFDAGLAKVVRRCGHSLEGDNVRLHDDGMLVVMGMCTSSASDAMNHLLTAAEGPQFSTRAESRLYRSWGGSVINMSALPEAKLAREAEIAYQMICMSTDYDCWHPSGDDVTVEMVMGNMSANAANARRFVGAVLDELARPEHSDLVNAKHLQGSAAMAGGMTKKEGRSEETCAKLRWLYGEDSGF